MDPISQARFDKLRKIDPANWTDADREFMRARRGYMPEEDANALGLTDAPNEPAVAGGSSEPVEAPVSEPSVEAPRPKKAKQ